MVLVDAAQVDVRKRVGWRRGSNYKIHQELSVHV